jgi:hypothetical protein
MNEWTKEEDQKLAELYQKNLPLTEISEILSRSVGGVRNRAYKLKISVNHNYTESELDYLKKNYSSDRLQEVSKVLGKHKTNVCRKARELGLDVKRIDFENPKSFKDETGMYRKVGWVRESDQQKKERLTKLATQAFVNYPHLRIKKSIDMKEYHKNNEHPRGMLGKTHSEEYRKQISKRVKEAWQDPNSVYNSEENKQKHSDYMHNAQMNRERHNPYSRTKCGKRQDLGGLFVRSSWEANYARYLNFLKEKKLIYKWEYEADVFEFKEIKRGTRSYTPDFKIWDKEDSIPYYVEIKGWMDEKSKTRLKRMSKYYPNIRLDLVQQKEYNEIKKKIKPFIKDWEG